MGARSLRFWLGRLAGCALLLWARTWRLLVEVHGELDPRALAEPQRTVFAFWHGAQMGLLALRPRRPRCPVSVMVSHSADGDIQAGILRTVGLAVVRGSSSRGGARALLPLVRAIRGGGSSCFAVDGPRGPLRISKPGAAAAAELGRAELVPVAVAASRVTLLRRTWDQFEIPWPFAKVAIVVGTPNHPSRALADTRTLDAALTWGRARAIELLERGRHGATAASEFQAAVGSETR